MNRLQQELPGIEFFQLSPLEELMFTLEAVDFVEMVYDKLYHNNQDVIEQRGA